MKKMSVFLCSLLLLLSPIVQAEMFVYPAEGQSQAKQDKDKYACHEWAVKETGIDPLQLAQQTYEMNETAAGGGSAAGGAARGATVGAIGGAIGGNAGKGAAIGGLVGMLHSRRQLRERQKYYHSQMAGENRKLHTYDQAYGTCLKGRGYTVSGA